MLLSLAVRSHLPDDFWPCREFSQPTQHHYFTTICSPKVTTWRKNWNNGQSLQVTWEHCKSQLVYLSSRQSILRVPSWKLASWWSCWLDMCDAIRRDREEIGLSSTATLMDAEEIWKTTHTYKDTASHIASIFNHYKMRWGDTFQFT